MIMKVYLVQKDIDLGYHTLKVFSKKEDAVDFSKVEDKRISRSIWCGHPEEEIKYEKHTFIEEFEVE
jgi:hypothetical protein